MPNFFDEENYVLCYQNLQLFFRLGLKPKKKIHSVLEFSQSQWLKPFLEFNTQKRIAAEKMVAKMESVVQINEQHCMW